MKKLILFLLLALLMASSAFSEPNAGPDISNAPVLNQGKKWRVAYIEGIPYANFTGTFFYLLKGLESRGWVKGVSKVPFTWGQLDTKVMWDYIVSTKDFSDFIEFVPDGYYSLKSIPGKEQDVLKRFTDNKEADLLIVMGTVAGKLMANDQTRAKTMVFSTSNALKSGIVKGVDSSGRTAIWAHMDPNRYKVQLQVFWDIFRFKKLGVVYEDSPNGKTFAAIDDIDFVAKEKHFDVVKKVVVGAKDYIDQDRYFKDLLQAHKELAGEVDALYYTVSPAPGLRQEHLFPVLKPLYDKKIPVFSLFGDDEVAKGVLLSIARADFSGMGQFGAEQLVKLLKGTAADALPQVYTDTPTIALNFEVSKQLGYKPPFEILLVSDKIFQTVEIPPPTPAPVVAPAAVIQAIVKKK